MRTIPELQAELLVAYEASDAARVATHEARRKLSEAQAKESAAADAAVNAEKALAAALDNAPPL